ncbi:type VI secretion protein [Sphingomonas sp. NSE70-1]|uniref:Type VI secretion protein n=1 Tax=Sphingomonas caseinilyticus TaxID=2908205 RepID=A0ABT0RW51_9SPHN|nr:type VI secretion protein [Sphingomonas caseinilyticus]MCL6699053.1 type VI secretion protein [Sphingomonas caseinilyticus]
MNKLLPIVVIALLAGPALAKDPPKQSPLVGALEACRAIADPTQRLACYDKEAAALVTAAQTGDVAVVDKAEVRKARKSLFGFAMPNLPFFSGDKSADEVSDTLESTVTKASGIGYGKFRMTIAEGNAVWETTETFSTMREPRSGDKIWIKRGTLGSYVLRIGTNKRGVKGKRVG